MEVLTILFALLLLGIIFLLILGRRANKAQWGGVFTNIIDGWVRLLVSRYHRLHYDAVQLPESGPAIVVANHISGLDPFLMITATTRPLHFLIATEQYRRFGTTWLFKRAGCIPVDRERRPEKALVHASEALAQGLVVALFPHGTIHLDSDNPRKLKRGVARLASLSGAPVYPLRIEGVKGQGHVLSALIHRGRPRIKAHAPIYCSADDEAGFLQRLAAILEGRDE